MPIGITGSTGQLGRLAIDKLKAKLPPGDLVALARTPAKAAGLGVPVRESDYDRPDTLAPALSGLDALLFIAGTEVGQKAVTQHRNVIEAAKTAGVGWIVYTSLLHADTSPLGLLAEKHRLTEAAIKESGIAYTLLRNGWYTENYTGTIPGALAGGAFIGSAGNAAVSPAVRADFAEAAVAVLTGQGHQGKTYELAGDQAFTMSDLAAEVSRQTGRTLPYRDMPEADYAAALASFGLPQPVAQTVAGYDTAARQGALFDASHQLSALIGRPTVSLAAAVAEALEQLPTA